MTPQQFLEEKIGSPPAAVCYDVVVDLLCEYERLVAGQFVTPLVAETTPDNVNHPAHYTSHPSGVECIEIARHYDFAIGNAIKYLWRNGLKVDPDRPATDKQIEDLRKAIWYINDKLETLEGVKYNQ